MGNQEGRGRGPVQSQNDATKKVEHTAKIAELEKRIHELKQGITASKSPQNGVAQEWIGTVVNIELMGGTTLRGILKSVDRYTYYLESDNPLDLVTGSKSKNIVVHKGAVSHIFQL